MYFIEFLRLECAESKIPSTLMCTSKMLRKHNAFLGLSHAFPLLGVLTFSEYVLGDLVVWEHELESCLFMLNGHNTLLLRTNSCSSFFEALTFFNDVLGKVSPGALVLVSRPASV